MGFWDFLKSKRPGELESLAHSLHYEFAAKDEFGLYNLIKDFQIAKAGGGRKIKHILSRTQDQGNTKIYIFDYQYTVSTGNSSSTFKQTIYFAYSKNLGLPGFIMKPQTLLHLIGHMFGKQDIDYIDYPQFSKQYYLNGDDRELIRHMISDEFLQYFTKTKGWSIEGLNYFLIFYRKHKLITPRDLPAFINIGDHIYKMLYERGYSV